MRAKFKVTKLQDGYSAEMVSPFPVAPCKGATLEDAITLLIVAMAQTFKLLMSDPEIETVDEHGNTIE